MVKNNDKRQSVPSNKYKYNNKIYGETQHVHLGQNKSNNIHKRRHTSPVPSEMDVDDIMIYNTDDEINEAFDNNVVNIKYNNERSSDPVYLSQKRRNKKFIQRKNSRRLSMDTLSVISHDGNNKFTRRYSNGTDDIYLVNEMEKEIRKRFQEAMNDKNNSNKNKRKHSKQFSLTLQSGLNAEKLVTDHIVNDMANDIDLGTSSKTFIIKNDKEIDTDYSNNDDNDNNIFGAYCGLE